MRFWQHFLVLVEANMVLTRRKRRQNRMCLRQLDDFDQDVIFGDGVLSGRQNVVLKSGPAGQKVAVNFDDSIPVTNDIMLDTQTLEKCPIGWIVRKMGNIIEIVEDRFQNASFFAINNIISTRIE